MLPSIHLIQALPVATAESSIGSNVNCHSTSLFVLPIKIKFFVLFVGRKDGEGKCDWFHEYMNDKRGSQYCLQKV
jgi:hypothetical protein